MWLIDIEAAPPRLRGRLSRWAIEVRAGLYVGSSSAKVRDAVWQFVCDGLGSKANAVLVYDARNPQGFEARTAGRNRRRIVDVDGMQLAQFVPNEDQRVPWDEPLDETEEDLTYLGSETTPSTKPPRTRRLLARSVPVKLSDNRL
jgi:CRISPR-associated protein Cas2